MLLNEIKNRRKIFNPFSVIKPLEDEVIKLFILKMHVTKKIFFNHFTKKEEKTFLLLNQSIMLSTLWLNCVRTIFGVTRQQIKKKLFYLIFSPRA